MNIKRVFHLLGRVWILGCVLPSLQAFAKSETSWLSDTGPGPFAFIEWNPAAIKDKTVGINGEYMVVDGVAFGGLIKLSDVRTEHTSLRSASLGLSVTQYFTEDYLSGLFARGDFSVFFDQYRVKEQIGTDRYPEYEVESGLNPGVSLGALLGYRFMFTRRITGSAGYGAIRNIPTFFQGVSSGMASAYTGQKGDWRFEVHAGIGVAL